MKIVILIIANDYPNYYIEMQEIWKIYMNKYANIKSYFIKCDNSISTEYLVDEKQHTIYLHP